MRRTAALIAVLTLAAIATGTPASGSITASALPVLSAAEGYKAASSRMFHTDPSLLRLSSSKPVGVVVKLDYDPVASYAGGVAGLAATSPSVTGRPLSASGPSVTAYQRYAERMESGVVSQLHQEIPAARVLYSYRLAYGGLAVILPANAVRTLAGIPQVVAVQQATMEHPLTDVTPFFLHAVDLWPALGGSKLAGDNVTVGVIDTGIWPEHPSFKDRGLPAPPGTYGCQFGDGTDPDLGPAFQCNHKLVGAYAFADGYLSFNKPLPGEFCDKRTRECSARDPEGHGTHTSSTAAGDAFRPAAIFGVDRGKVSGMAPGAHLIMYRTCLALGCYLPDLVAAVNQAIADGVNVINYSISGGTAYDDAVEAAFLDAYAAGISVNAAAANSGPAPGTVNHVGPWTDTVGAATSPRQFVTTLHLASSDGATLDVQGVSVTAGLDSPVPVIQAAKVPGYHDALCRKPLPVASVTGDLVLCERGITARVQKGYNVLQGGGAGMVLYNPLVEDLESDNHWLPAVHIDYPPAQQVLAFLGAHPGVTGMFSSGQPTAVRPDVMAAFSSRGPFGDFIKPDVVAPGIQVLAGHTPQPADIVEGPPGELYQAIAGTSMASPHAAGLAALLKAVHPDWTPGQIKSALVTSAVTDVVKEDGSTPATPFDDGAGRIQADRAAATPLTFDVPASDYIAKIGDPLQRIDLNTPSIDAPVMPGIVTTQRTAANVTAASLTFHVVTTAPPGAAIKVSPKDFTVPASGTQTLNITIDGSTLPDGQYFGSILLKDGDAGTTNVRLPVAFHKQQGPVLLTNGCDDLTIGVDATASCGATVTNTVGGSTTYHLDVQAKADAADLSVGSVSAPGTPKGNGFTADDELTPYTSPVIERIDSGGPAFVDLPNLGINPLSGVGDETLVNLGTPKYMFGGQTYTAVGIVSNGYAVLGGGGASSVSIHPQTFPDPALPNNVIAPLWTDLDPSAGGYLYAGKVTQDGATWFVLEWRKVPVYQTTMVQTFEIWIETGATEDVGFVYQKVSGSGAATGLNAGAENSDGSSGLNLGIAPAAGDAYTVIASGPRPGESETINYLLTGHTPGKYRVVARMTSPLMIGLAVQELRIKVSQ
jgi:subtilisin family serine protease